MRYPKKGRKVLRKPARVKYQFILEYSHQFKIKTMCRVLKIARAGYCAWLHEPKSGRTIEKISGYYSSSALLMMPVMVSRVIIASCWILKS
jgi:hypothetical protein